MTNVYKLALFGYGYWGKKLYQEFSSHPGFKILGVNVRNPNKFTQDDEVQRLVRSASDIFSDQQIDAVVIATPVQYHFEIGKQTLNTDKDLFIEKTLTLRETESIELLRLANQKGKKVLVDYTYSFSPVIKKIKEFVDHGELGLVEYIDVWMAQLGRFNQSDVYTLLGSHMLAVVDRIIPVKCLDFYKIDMLFRNGIVESGAIPFKKKDEVTLTNISPRFKGMIRISLNYPSKERKITILGSHGTFTYDLLADQPLACTKYEVNRSISEHAFNININRFADLVETKGLQNAVSVFYNLLLTGQGSNLETAVVIDRILANMSPVIKEDKG